MKIKGKVAIWFWILMWIGEGSFFYFFRSMPQQRIPLVIGFLYFNLMLIPLIVNNYVELDRDELTVVFGFERETIPVMDIVQIYSTHNPVSVSATSFDRLVIKGSKKKLICAVQDKERLLHALIEKNKGISFEKK